MENLSLPGNFIVLNDLSATALNWQKWKRSLTIYWETIQVKVVVRKRSVLLHSAGQDLQDIIYNIPGAIVEANENIDVFSIAVQKLEDYFAPKLSRIFERHSFRKLKQDKNEKFDDFLIKLRKQAEKCQFIDKDLNIIDQIAKGCDSEKLRRKILESYDRTTLDEIILMAKTFETVNSQISNFAHVSEKMLHTFFMLK